jgi:hypothetical protein
LVRLGSGGKNVATPHHNGTGAIYLPHRAGALKARI